LVLVWVDFAPEIELTFVTPVERRLMMGVYYLAGIAPEWFLPLLLFLLFFNRTNNMHITRQNNYLLHEVLNVSSGS
jgi:hypothetical protein